MNGSLAKLLPRIALLLISGTVGGWLAPAQAAFGLLSVALIAGWCFRSVRLQSVLMLVGGLVGLAARHSGGSFTQFERNLWAFAALLIVMLGCYIMARGSRTE